MSLTSTENLYIASAKVMQNDYEDDDELDYAYVIDAKTKRR